MLVVHGGRVRYIDRTARSAARISAGSGDEPHTVERKIEQLRVTVYSTIVMLAALVVLSEREPGAVDAILSVVGTALVLFFADVYAATLAERIGRGRPAGDGTVVDGKKACVRDLARGCWPVLAVAALLLAPLVLAAVEVLDTASALFLAMWLALLSLGVWGWVAGRMRHDHLRNQLWGATRTLLVGILIVALKILFE